MFKNRDDNPYSLYHLPPRPLQNPIDPPTVAHRTNRVIFEKYNIKSHPSPIKLLNGFPPTLESSKILTMP